MNIKLETLIRGFREVLEAFWRKSGLYFLLDEAGLPVGAIALFPSLPPLPSFDSEGVSVDVTPIGAPFTSR